jgi:hypothetical protein
VRGVFGVWHINCWIKVPRDESIWVCRTGKAMWKVLECLDNEYPYAVLGIEGITPFLCRLIPLNRIYFSTFHDANSHQVSGGIVGRNR